MFVGLHIKTRLTFWDPEDVLRLMDERLNESLVPLLPLLSMLIHFSCPPRSSCCVLLSPGSSCFFLSLVSFCLQCPAVSYRLLLGLVSPCFLPSSPVCCSLLFLIVPTCLLLLSLSSCVHQCPVSSYLLLYPPVSCCSPLFCLLCLSSVSFVFFVCCLSFSSPVFSLFVSSVSCLSYLCIL